MMSRPQSIFSSLHAPAQARGDVWTQGDLGRVQTCKAVQSTLCVYLKQNKTQPRPRLLGSRDVESPRFSSGEVRGRARACDPCLCCSRWRLFCPPPEPPPLGTVPNCSPTPPPSYLMQEGTSGLSVPPSFILKMFSPPAVTPMACAKALCTHPFPESASLKTNLLQKTEESRELRRRHDG